ncbi:caldesmon-like [Argopecten irradians]|uniref:caldesmon-like n=1 Tax=Argopecten irradians TaxID=31199 RepID=UPI00371F3F7A
MSGRGRRPTETTDDGSDDDQFEAFREIIRTIRSRKSKRPVSQQSSGPSTAQARSVQETPSVDLNLYQNGEHTEYSFPEEEVEEEPRHTPTEEEANEVRVRNYIKDRMQKYRNKKKEERQKLLAERKARWIERQKRLGVYVEPSESASTSSGSSMSGLTDEERQVKRETRRRLHKLIPLNTVVDELRKNLDLETNLRGDFLETIRIIRGINKDDFYRRDTPEICEEEEEQEEEEEETVEEVETEDAETPPKKTDYNKVQARVSSRWPKGHRHHTKAVKADWSFLTQYSDAELSVELAYLLPVYMRDVERLRKARRQKLTSSTSSFKTKRIQRNLDFESWREEMMRIAYDEDFAKGKSKMFSTVPLPKIKETSSVANTSSSSRVTLFDARESPGRDDNWSPQGPNTSSLLDKQKQPSPYQYNQKQKSPRPQEQLKTKTATRNRHIPSSQYKSVSKLYKPVGRRNLVNNEYKPVKNTSNNTHMAAGNGLEKKSNGVVANGTNRGRTKPKDVDLQFESMNGHTSENATDSSGGSSMSTSDQVSQDGSKAATITVYFNADQTDLHKKDQNRTKAIKIPRGSSEQADQKFVIRINSPMNRDGKVTKLFDDIQQYKSRHPNVDQIQILVRTNDVAHIKWVCQYVENQSRSQYKAEV